MCAAGWLVLPVIAACRPAPGIPDWAMHVPPPIVDPGADVDALLPRLMAELHEGGYRPDRIAPEQLATLGIRELSRSRPWDAAVLVALASYRYFEQAHYAFWYGSTEGYRIARQRTGGRLDDEDYREFLELEVETYAAAGFDSELERIAAQLGASIEDHAVEEDLTRIAMGNMHDRYGAQAAFEQRFDSLKRPAPESLAHPALAAAVRARLAADAGREGLSEVAVRYLARVPLRSFRLAALHAVGDPLHGLVVRAGLRLYVDEPEPVVQALGSQRGATRSHAALILGHAEALTELPRLEAQLAVETDPFVQLSLRYALVRLGELEQIAALQHALSARDPALVEHALALLHWLPDDLQAELSQAAVVAALRRRGATPAARYVGVALLRDLSRHAPLGDAALAAMFDVARLVSEHEDAAARVAGLIADVEQLDRTRVLAAVRADAQPRLPWLSRLRRLAEPQDLPVLDTLMRRPGIGADERAAAVLAVAAIEGQAAQAVLERWFSRYKDVRTLIALQLVLRDDADKPRLLRMVEQHGDAQVSILLLALHAESAGERLAGYLRSRDPGERYAATFAVKLFGDASHRRLLWPNVVYHDARYYPGDVALRQLTLGALLDLQLNRAAHLGGLLD